MPSQSCGCLPLLAILLATACSSTQRFHRGADRELRQEPSADEPPSDDIANESAGELARKTQNPVADLISLPFQNNTNFGVGPGEDVQNILNIQPVIPTHLSDDWLLISRAILPVIYQPEMVAGMGSEFGLGDLSYTAFLSPKGTGEWTWGAGPVLQLPTATDQALGAQRWALGASAVALVSTGPWVAGGLINNVWSVGGSSKRDINQMLLQPFINYNLGKGAYLVSAPIMTANWEASSGNRWTVPLGGGIGKVFKPGGRPINTSLQAYYMAVSPDLGPEWQLRFQVQLLF